MKIIDGMRELSRGKTFPRAVEHFLAMFPATVLMPLTVNAAVNQAVIDIPLTLFTSGVGTLIFLLITRIFLKECKIPAYLGSSFAFIGMTVYLLNSFKDKGFDTSLAYSYIGWAYAFGGGILIILSFLFRLPKAKDVFDRILPPSVIGPAISLIGLDLADSAVKNAGFVQDPGSSADLIQLSGTNSIIVAMVTLSIIILMTITRRKSLKNSAIVLGMFGGFFLAVFLCDTQLSLSMFNANLIIKPQFSFPVFSVPPNLLQLFLTVLPATLVVFTENISRVTVISRMTDQSREGKIFSPKYLPKFSASVFGHGAATLVAAALGSVPCTLYAENIAVMSTNRDKLDDELGNEFDDKFCKLCHNSFSYIPYLFAALLAILASFSGHIQQFLMNIPSPVLGGMKLFLFGIISAPGIQLLVEQRVNYKKLSNQLITASVLIMGISEVKIPLWGVLDLQGMSLGFAVGIFVNLLIVVLDSIGRLNDNIEIDELFFLCVKSLPGNMFLRRIENRVCKICVDEIKELYSERNERKAICVSEELLSAETFASMASQSDCIEFDFGEDSDIVLRLKRGDYALYVYIKERNMDNPRRFIQRYRHPKENAVESIDDYIRVRIGANVSLRVLQSVIEKLHR